MRQATLHEVRELLSSAGASRFFEAWAEVDGARAQADELVESSAVQRATAEARVQAAEEAAKEHEAQAAAAYKRAARKPASRKSSPPRDERVHNAVRLEAQALAEVADARAERAHLEATERRQRVRQLVAELADAQAALATAREAEARLKVEAESFGGHVGERCLFFADAEVAGGLFVVPLSPIPLSPEPLEAFTLYRLAPDAPLSAAQAIRDRTLKELHELPDLPAGGDADDFEPPSEARLGRTENT